MTVSWRAGKSFPEGFTEKEVLRTKLDRMEEALNKLGECKPRRKVKDLKVYSKLLALQSYCNRFVMK